MGRLLAIFVVLAGLLAAGTPTFACGAAGGDCCSPSAPAGCAQVYSQLGVGASNCCVAATMPAQVAAAEFNRGSPDPVALPASPFVLPDLRYTDHLTVSLTCSARTDASLTYLHTARLRL